MSVNHQEWHRTIPGKLISPDHIHVWQISLDTNASAIERLLECLSGDEVERAGRFVFEKDRKRFIAARGSLRFILGVYLNEHPHQIKFAYSLKGKPQLKDSYGSRALQFNLSHSDALALCAVTLHRHVGVDIERIRHDLAFEQIASHFFSQQEISSLESCQNNGHYEAFFRYWTRKEAFLKARGEGISFKMGKFDVSAMSDKAFVPVIGPDENKENEQWYVRDLFPGEGYVAAIAVEGACCQVTCLYFSP